MRLKRYLPLIMLAATAAGFVGGYGYGRWYGPGVRRPESVAAPAISRYSCPMHPSVVSDKPGKCPECGMDLVASDAPEAAPESSASSLYHCPMHPSFTSDSPGECAICGMKLVPSQGSTAATDATESTGRVLPPGAVRVSPEKQQLIGVRFGSAVMSSWGRGFRTAGRIAIDETRVTRVQARVDGWIESVFVDFVGKPVAKEQPLLTLYSPELVATQQELLLALRSREVLKSSPLSGSSASGEALVAAARKRLELWEMTDTQIAELERSGTPSREMTLYSPSAGVVLARNALRKQRVTPDTELYTIADLGRVWVFADVFEGESDSVRLGTPVRIVSTYTGRTVVGAVDFIQPQLDAMTRTLKVRISAANPGVALKPDMWVDVEFRGETPPRLTVPAGAVLDTGLRKTVFLDLGNGYFEPRVVETGESTADRVEIVKGLQAGDRIVISGNFLLDSESQLRAAALGMGSPQSGAQEHRHD